MRPPPAPQQKPFLRLFAISTVFAPEADQDLARRLDGVVVAAEVARVVEGHEAVHALREVEGDAPGGQQLGEELRVVHDRVARRRAPGSPCRGC